MVSIVLTVLKIIGICILALLGIVVLLLLCVLFVPVRYRAQGDYREQAAHVKGRVTWLLHAVSFSAQYENGQPFHLCLRLFGIPVFDSLRPSRRKRENKKAKTTENKSEDIGEIQAASVPEPKESAAAQGGGNDDVLDDREKAAVSFDWDTEKVNFIQKVRIIIKKFVDFFRNLKFTFRKICATIVEIKDNITYYLDVLRLDSTKQAFAACKNQLVRTFRKLAPKKYSVRLHLGFDDPAKMGEVLAVWGMLYPLHEGNVDIQPEFDRNVMEGCFSLKGNIRILVFLQAFCSIYFDKNIKRLIRQLKNGANKK